VPWRTPAGAIAGAACHDNGAFSVADPRPVFKSRRGTYGVVRWDEPSGVVKGMACHDNGAYCVADPRAVDHFVDTNDMVLPAPADRLVAVIRALDGTWHRPFTTLELAALQGLVDPDEHLELAGISDTAWRERIGNAVPSPAAEAIASVMAHALLLAWQGETWELSALPVWVRPVATAISVEGVS
jgi:hypothetical protein